MKDRLKFILAMVLYGTIGLFLRFVDLPSEAAALYRGLIGAAFIALFRLARRDKFDGEAVRRNLKWLLLGGVFLGLNWVSLFAAYVTTTVAVASLCNYMAPIFVIILAPLVLRERLDVRKLPCIAVALVGIVLVSGIIGGEMGRLSGIALGLASAVCFTGIVICNRKLRDISAYDRTLFQLAVAVVTMIPYVLARNGGRVPLPGDLRSWLLVLMLGVLQTGVAYVLYFDSMGTLPVQTIAILGYLEPVVAVFCSAIFLREPLGIAGWIGAVLILAAALVSELIPDRKPQDGGEAAP